MNGSYVLCALAATFALSLSAQSAKPPLNILVGYPPGGSDDVIARQIASRMSAGLDGQSVVAENKPGAAGRIAIDALKNAAPEGSTVIVMPSGPVVLFPHVYKKLNYDPVKDLAPISQLASFQFCIVSGPKTNVKNMAEMRALPKSDPGSTNFGSSGNGTVPHFPGIMLGDAAGIPMNHVPFQGGAPAMNALLGGHVGYTTDVVTEALEQHRSGKARIIAVAGANRATQVPEVPTLRDQGVPIRRPSSSRQFREPISSNWKNRSRRQDLRQAELTVPANATKRSPFMVRCAPKLKPTPRGVRGTAVTQAGGEKRKQLFVETPI